MINMLPDCHLYHGMETNLLFQTSGRVRVRPNINLPSVYLISKINVIKKHFSLQLKYK